MNSPDLDLARRFLAAHPPPGQLLLCAVTGSHLYGFPSPDSDIDMKGIHLAPTAQVLGLRSPPETHDRLLEHEGVECDLTTHEAAFALRLLLKGNGNMLERLTSPLQLVERGAVEQLRALVPASLSQACYGHYRGYLRGMQREHLRDRRVKSLLYSFRVGLTGVHLLRTGEVQAHLPTLADAYGFPELHALVALKASGHEKVALDEALGGGGATGVTERLAEVEAMLDEARASSTLPDAPAGEAACNDWLVATRRADGRTAGGPA